jgi:AbrB family looped-hinge helix DNA binding protein
MPITIKVTSKGQVTIPKKIRDILRSDTVEFEVINGNVVVKPVKSVGGSLSQYAKKYIPLKKIRGKAWEAVASDRATKKAT